MPNTVIKTVRPRRPTRVMLSLPAASAKTRRSEAEKRTARRMLEILKSGADLRERKVRRIRGAIRAGKYENDLKLEVAIDRLIEDLGI